MRNMCQKVLLCRKRSRKSITGCTAHRTTSLIRLR